MTRLSNDPARFGLFLERFAHRTDALAAVIEAAQRLTRHTQEVSR